MLQEEFDALSIIYKEEHEVNLTMERDLPMGMQTFGGKRGLFGLEN